MLIYNTSFHVEGDALIGPFRTYMRDIYLPKLIERGYVKNPRFVSLLTDIGEGMQGFSLMCEVENVVVLKKWKKEIGDELMMNFHNTFGERILTFSTSMKVIEL